MDRSCGTTCGTLIRKLESDRVRVTESVYDGEGAIPDHEHVLPSVCVVLEGGYRERYRSTDLACTTGTAVFHAPGDPHSNRFGRGGGRCLDITVSADLVAEAFGGGSVSECRSGSRLVLPRTGAFRIWRELHGADALGPRILEETAVALLGELLDLPGLRLGSETPPWLARTREHVHEEYVDPPTLETLAAGAGVHRGHLARAFRKRYGCTVGEYVRIRRVSVAVGALRSSNRPLGRIAYAVGFADQSHFTRTFRQLVGVTPGTFRRRYRRVA